MYVVKVCCWSDAYTRHFVSPLLFKEIYFESGSHDLQGQRLAPSNGPNRSGRASKICFFHQKMTMENIQYIVLQFLLFSYFQLIWWKRIEMLQIQIVCLCDGWGLAILFPYSLSLQLPCESEWLPTHGHHQQFLQEWGGGIGKKFTLQTYEPFETFH